MTETADTYMVLTGIQLITAVVWLLNAFAAYGSWRAFRVRADVLWLVAFLILALISSNRAFQAYDWSTGLSSGLLAGPIVDMLGNVSFGALRFAAIEMVGVLLVFFAFRSRRVRLD